MAWNDKRFLEVLAAYLKHIGGIDVDFCTPVITNADGSTPPVVYAAEVAFVAATVSKLAAVGANMRLVKGVGSAK